MIHRTASSPLSATREMTSSSWVRFGAAVRFAVVARFAVVVLFAAAMWRR